MNYNRDRDYRHSRFNEWQELAIGTAVALTFVYGLMNYGMQAERKEKLAAEKTYSIKSETSPLVKMLLAERPLPKRVAISIH